MAIKQIFILLFFSMLWAASPFFDSSVYVIYKKANIRSAPTISAEIVFTAENGEAFKFEDKIVNGDIGWYKIQYYDPKEYDIYYKRWGNKINPNNFQQTLTLYTEPTETAKSIRVIPTKKRVKYDNKKATVSGWVRMRVMKPKIAYVSDTVVKSITRPYFLAEIALAAIKKYNRWSYRTRNNVLNGKIARNMTPEMIKAIKGDPDRIDKDKSSRNAYYTWWYGSQTVNFRYGRVTSW